MVKIDSGSSTLAIFQRHVEQKAQQDGTANALPQEQKKIDDSIVLDNSFKMEAKAFSQNTKSANEAIGMLQIAEINLNKIGKQLDSESTDSDTEINAILENTSFMGNPVFGSEINIRIGNQNVALDLNIDDGTSITQEKVQEKKAEIKAIMGQISNSLTESTEALSSSKSNYDFNTFDPNMMKNLGNAF